MGTGTPGEARCRGRVAGVCQGETAGLPRSPPCTSIQVPATSGNRHTHGRKGMLACTPRTHQRRESFVSGFYLARVLECVRYCTSSLLSFLFVLSPFFFCGRPCRRSSERML